MSSLRLKPILDASLTPKGAHGHDYDYVCPFCEKSGQQGTLHVNFVKGDGCAVCHQCWYGTRNVLYIFRDLFGAIPKSAIRATNRLKFVVDIEAMLTDPSSSEAPSQLPESFRPLPTRPTDLTTKFIYRYIRKRGVTAEDIDKWGIGYVTNDEHPAHGYVLFPFYMGGKCVYWQGRKVFGPGPKSYNPSQSHKKSILYGYDQAVGQSTLFCVEGCFDAIAWGPGGVALTGMHATVEQCRAMALLGAKSIIVCLDPDAWYKSVSAKSNPNRSKMPAPLAVAYELARRTQMRVGTLKLVTGDPDEVRSSIHALADKYTRWIDKRDVSSYIEHVVSTTPTVLKKKRKRMSFDVDRMFS